MISMNKQRILKQAQGIYRIKIIFALLITFSPAFSLGQTNSEKASVKGNPAIQVAPAPQSQLPVLQDEQPSVSTSSKKQYERTRAPLPQVPTFEDDSSKSK